MAMDKKQVRKLIIFLVMLGTSTITALLLLITISFNVPRFYLFSQKYWLYVVMIPCGLVAMVSILHSIRKSYKERNRE